MTDSQKILGRYGALLLLGAVLDFVVGAYPANLPVRDAMGVQLAGDLAVTLSLAWFFRGLKALPREDIGAVAQNCFVAGVLSFWIVLQTHIDYYAQHMFFVHRWAHFVLHHLGAFLIALGMSGKVLWAGMPAFLKPPLQSRPVSATMSFLQHPAVAPILFVALLYFWLIPQLHTVVMLSRPLYSIMNWTMAINGIMFWALVLDSRAKPPARLSHLMRALMILVIELPQMVLGAILSLTETDFYPVYDICGRVIPMTALNDLHYGGLIIWLPSTLTSFVAMIVVLVTMRLNEEREERERLGSG